MQATLAPRRPFEVLNGIGQVHPLALNTRFLQQLVKQFTRGTHERLTQAIFYISRLFTHHDNVCPGRA
jgi:hypothetical protein